MGEYDEILVQEPIRTGGKIASGSHYSDKNFKYGRSRDAGDASPEVQRQVINALVTAEKEAGLTDREIGRFNNKWDYLGLPSACPGEGIHQYYLQRKDG